MLKKRQDHRSQFGVWGHLNIHLLFYSYYLVFHKHCKVSNKLWIGPKVLHKFISECHLKSVCGPFVDCPPPLGHSCNRPICQLCQLCLALSYGQMNLLILPNLISTSLFVIFCFFLYLLVWFPTYQSLRHNLLIVLTNMHVRCYLSQQWAFDFFL